MKTLKSAAPKPVAIALHSDGEPRLIDGRRVVDVKDDWEIDTDWWTRRPLDRCYYELILEGGHNVVVFLDRRAGRWSKQRA